ncbi:MAG: Na+/H+ antiporter NhaA [Acidothermaceae bacterium]
MSDEQAPVDSASDEQSGRTTWSRRIRTPFRDFQHTESASAVYLVAATVAALVWVNVDQQSYDTAWHTSFSLSLGKYSVSTDLRGWVNSGLMTLFFFVVGLEARREFDVGELRERRRVALPVLAGIGGMVIPIVIFLGFNAGTHAAHGWGAAMSTDTAFALGILALVGPRFPDRLRSFMLTVVVVDDLVALVVIVVAYTADLAGLALGVAIALFAGVLIVRGLRIRRSLIYVALAAAIWVALFKSGVDPVVVGLGMGLLTYAYPADRAALENATEEFKLFREQPTAELARQAGESVKAAVSPNARLQQLFHPWTSYLIVPIFALANIGIPLSGHFLADAFTSAVTLGIICAYVIGKPVGIVTTSWVVTKVSRGRLRPPVGWAAVGGAGTIAGIGFTVSLLIASLAFTGTQLQEAKVGVLSAAVLASLLTWLSFRVTEMLPAKARVVALLGRSESIVDLADAVDPERDHLRGSAEAAVTLVEYGDLECPYCGQAEPVVRELLADFGDVRYVWRHLPLTDVHPHAQLAAEATEAAAMQDAFWEMHDLLMQHQNALRPRDLIGYAAALGLDVDRFTDDLKHHAGAARVESDVDSADLSGVTGTPTFFVNGRRHHGAFDIDSLTAAVRSARARAAIVS